MVIPYGDKELSAKHPGMTAMFQAINQAEQEAMVLAQFTKLTTFLQ